MIIISHRGNLDKVEENLENSPKRIDQCINENFNIEVDLRYKDNSLFLGHDFAQYEIDEQWLIDRRNYLWVHCKDRESLTIALSADLNCFWHDSDDYTITSMKYVWAYPGKEPSGKYCVAVLPEKHWSPEEIVRENKFFAICTDIPVVFREILNRQNN